MRAASCPASTSRRSRRASTSPSRRARVMRCSRTPRSSVRSRRRGGRRVVHFAATPPLSTYLLAIAVGPLEASPVRHLGPIPIRVWHVPGKGHLAAFGLEAAHESLARLEDYFGIPYPYAKLDLVAVPGLRGGRDGERRRGVLPRDAAPPRPRHRVAPRAQARRRGDRARARAHVVRRPRHHGVVGRPLAERGVRHLDGVPGRRRVAARVADVAGLRARPGRRARRSTG